MKHSITKHKMNCANRENHVARIKSELDRMQAKYDRCTRELALYKAQIELAEEEGKDGFDETRYAIERINWRKYYE